MKLINADKLKADMYHNAFEIDNDLQKWDSGCWIRYKLFENVIEEQPTVEAVTKDWIIKYIISIGGSNGVTKLHKEILKTMLEDWEEENANDKEKEV